MNDSFHRSRSRRRDGEFRPRSPPRRRPKRRTPQPAPREQTLLEEVAAGMREVLRAVTPEISLPKLEIKLPTLDRAPR